MSSPRIDPLPPPASESKTVPIVEEQLHLITQPVVGDTVRVSTRVVEREEIVELPTTLQTVEVERVPINREIDGPVSPRQEGDTLIVPVVEEVYVVQKKLMLREEIRLTTRQIKTIDRQSVTLRRTEATVERRPEPAAPVESEGTQSRHS